MLVLINGSPEHLVSSSDRGLNYGDGLFETIAVANGKPQLWQSHLDRLNLGCQRLQIPTPEPQLLWNEALGLTQHCNCGVLKILITRGIGGRGYTPAYNPKPTRILSLHSQPQYPSHWWIQGIKIRTCNTILSTNPILAKIKHTNRLEQILASMESKDPNTAEGLMQNITGQWICGTKTNFFLVQSKRLITPPINNCGIIGIMRNYIMAKARNHGWQVLECPVETSDLMRASGIFVTNSIIGIWPVQSLDSRQYDTDALPLNLRRLWLQDITCTPLTTIACDD